MKRSSSCSATRPWCANSSKKTRTSRRKRRRAQGIYKKLRPGEPENAENAEKLLESLFFDEKRYDLAGVGRYKLYGKFHYRIANPDPDQRVNKPSVVIDEYADAGLEMPAIETRCLTRADMIAVIRRLIKVATGVVVKEDWRIRVAAGHARDQIDRCATTHRCDLIKQADPKVVVAGAQIGSEINGREGVGLRVIGTEQGDRVTVGLHAHFENVINGQVGNGGRLGGKPAPSP